MKCPSKSCNQIWRLEICKCSECKNQEGLRWSTQIRNLLKGKIIFVGETCVFKKEVEFEVPLRDLFADIDGERFYPGLRSVRTEARVRGKLKARSRRSQGPCVSEL